MNDKDWKEYRRQADNGEHPEVKTRDVLDLLDERDALRKALGQAKVAMCLAITRIPYGDKEPRVIKELKAAIQSAS